MDLNEFNRQYKLSRARLLTGETTDVDSAQAELRAVADALAGREQEVATKLIDLLPAAVAAAQEPPPERSPEMLEALRVIDETNFVDGTREERLAAFAEARKRIWAIADRAGADSDRIRWITRGFECTEKYLEEGLPWEQPLDSSGC
jgi:hypothetical protein